MAGHSIQLPASQQDDGRASAVEVCSVYKNYGSGRSCVRVLHDCSLDVKQGHIYGLLGPSGCGKTTLLRCVVGRLKVDQGLVHVLGHKPGSPESGVPGKTIGYMPQEIALFNEFTIGETMSFFGRILGMTRAEVSARTKFLVEFLDLPDTGRLVSQLSGGQRRRVSLAAALLHSPRILILDEPTVGVDPLLRSRIWDHLVGVARTGSTTVIITTHYIEEARQADVVGLMRDGRILEQSPPDEMIRVHAKATLEAVFLHLCILAEQNEEEHEAAERSSRSLHETVSPTVGLIHRPRDFEKRHAPPKERTKLCPSRCPALFPRPRNCLAMTIKNLTVLKRKIGFLLFQFLLPAVQISLFSLCIGNTPYDLPVAVVNADSGIADVEGIPMNLSVASNYLDVLDSKTLFQNSYTSLDQAIDSVKHGDNWAVLAFGANYTADFVTRIFDPASLNPTSADGGSIRLWLDTTNQQISLTIVDAVTNAFDALGRRMAQRFNGIFPNVSTLPLVVEDPIYGVKDPTFLDFMAPGVIITIIYFMATGLTALSFVLDRKEGLTERTLVSGVTMSEVMIGHVAAQFLVMCLQAAVLLVFALAVFQIYCVGSLVLVVILVLLQGLCGMALGLVISSVATSEMSATQAALGCVYPVLIISGIIWPIEGMPPVIRDISYSLPMTYSGEAMRFIMGRGWGLTYIGVWRGFVMPIGWSILFCTASAAIITWRGI